MPESVLVMAAHPDDDVLGCGGTMAWHAARGDRVRVVFATDGVGARGTGASLARRAAADRACSLLGAEVAAGFALPDNRLDSVPLLELARTMEGGLKDFRPDVIYTHCAADLNIDHQLVRRAVLTAFRPFDDSSVREILAFEVVSSTEWSSGPVAFRPVLAVDIAPFVSIKLAALREYEEELRPFPHPRSLENVEALARVRGSQFGLNAAEAFEVERWVRR